MAPARRIPRALTIAGSDSGGGAGIQADLKTFAAHGVFGMSAVSAITAQNTVGVHDVLVCSPELVVRQIEVVCTDLGVDAAKTGMLGQAGVVEAVAEAVQRLEVPNLVVDPVMVAKGGERLLADEAVAALRDALLPLATCATPNVPEAEVLLGTEITGADDLAAAAAEICRLGPSSAVLKGGHLEGDRVVDVLFADGEVVRLESDRIDTRHTHGTGCTFSAALAAGLARGLELEPAVRSAHAYVHEAIRRAPGLGAGHGPLWHGVDPPDLDP